MKNVYDLMHQILDYLRKEEFSERTIANYSTVYKRLLSFCGSQDYSIEVGIDFLEQIYQINMFDKTVSKENRKVIRAINIVNDLYQFNYVNIGRTFKSIKKENKYPASLLVLFQDFCTSRKEQFKLSDITMKNYQSSIFSLYDFLIYHGIETINLVTIEILNKYIQYISTSANTYLYAKLSNLKLFFEYLYSLRFITLKLWEYLPKANHRRRVFLPYALTIEQRNKVLATIDRNSRMGKRNYAIVLLGAHLGLRAGDIGNLKFSNFNWEKDEISITMEKTKKEITLPITAMIGEAIIEYLKYSRPVSDSPFVFLTHSAPYKELSSSRVSATAHQAIQSAKLDLPSEITTGMHLFRHTLASSLLQQGMKLETISEVLGHSNVETTSVYLHIDVETLRTCSLEVPTFTWEGDDFNG